MPRMDSPLFAPWRMEYIRSLDKSAGAADPDAAYGGCFLCGAGHATTDDDRRRRFILWRTELTVVLMNAFPYNNGHLLIAPAAHKAEPEELTDAERADLMLQTTECVRLLKRAVSAQGFNIGINLGKCAGAGLPGHLHQHVVPRWAGDTNFMGVVGEVRVVPQAMSQLYEELLDVRSRMVGRSQGSGVRSHESGVRRNPSEVAG
jgi:ATP adenylyltransferase